MNWQATFVAIAVVVYMVGVSWTLELATSRDLSPRSSCVLTVFAWVLILAGVGLAAGLMIH